MISRIRRFRAAPHIAALIAALWLSGCASEETTDTDAATTEAAQGTESEQGGEPEVFFTNAEDGATYGTSFEVIFSVDNFNIVPIEDPLVARTGEGHYHLAIDADCVAAGEIIPPGTPSYVHFGTGNDRITVQLEPGDHGLCLQVADGEHRVIDGPDHSMLTKEIHFTVAEQ